MSHSRSLAFLQAGTRTMGSGLLRELLILEKIAIGGVYVTDPAVPTVSGPKLTAWDQECVTVGNMHKKHYVNQ